MSAKKKPAASTAASELATIISVFGAPKTRVDHEALKAVAKSATVMPRRSGGII